MVSVNIPLFNIKLLYFIVTFQGNSLIKSQKSSFSSLIQKKFGLSLSMGRPQRRTDTIAASYFSYTVVTEKSIYREYMEVAVFHSEL
jgi:hypothetical protein